LNIIRDRFIEISQDRPVINNYFLKLIPVINDILPYHSNRSTMLHYPKSFNRQFSPTRPDCPALCRLLNCCQITVQADGNLTRRPLAGTVEGQEHLAEYRLASPACPSVTKPSFFDF
jgi:hypothetical protein